MSISIAFFIGTILTTTGFGLGIPALSMAFLDEDCRKLGIDRILKKTGVFFFLLAILGFCLYLNIELAPELETIKGKMPIHITDTGHCYSIVNDELMDLTDECTFEGKDQIIVDIDDESYLEETEFVPRWFGVVYFEKPNEYKVVK